MLGTWRRCSEIAGLAITILVPMTVSHRMIIAQLVLTLGAGVLEGAEDQATPNSL